MSLKDKASLIFKPSRYKSGTAYSFRGSDVTVSRSSVGTRVNAEGKIEEVAANVPRLNYDPSDLTKCPTLLVEKDSSNLISNGINLGSLNKTRVTTIDNQDSPDAESGKGVKLNINSSTANPAYLSTSFAATNGTQYTVSIYAKAGEYPSFQFHHYGSAGIKVDLRSGEVVSNASDTTYDVKEHNDGWWRVSMTWTSTQTSSDSVYISPTQNPLDNYYSAASTSGEGIYIYGLQAEPTVSEPTSLLKTTGSTVTRDDDTVTASSPITSSRGSFYINMSSMHTIGYGTSVPSVAVYKTNTTTGAIGLLDNNVTNGEMRPCARLNGTLYYYNTHFSAPNGFKMCFVWDSNDSDTKVYKNGVLFGTIGVSVTQTFDTGVDLNAGTRENFFEYEEVMIYNERLSEADAIALTSYDDYQELVDRNELTWESPTITNNRLTALQEL